MRNLSRVLADILAVEGLDPALGPALASVRASVAYAAPERQAGHWTEAFFILKEHLGTPPKGESEVTAWAIWTDRTAEEFLAAIGALE